MECPACKCVKLHGPGYIVVNDTRPEAVTYRYWDCARCHCLVVEDPTTKELSAKGCLDGVL